MCRTGITSFIIYSLLALLLKHRPGAASYALGLGLTRPPALPRAQLERLGLFPLPELPVQEPQGGGGGQAEFEGKANPPPPGSAEALWPRRREMESWKPRNAHFFRTFLAHDPEALLSGHCETTPGVGQIQPGSG